MEQTEDDDAIKVNYGSSQVRVVSFDLDNTLWKTGPTIQAANDVMKAYLDEKDISQPERVEKVMGQLFKLSKSTYAPLAGDDAKAPVLLTQLRKDALRFVLEEHNGYSEVDATEFADRAFAIWTTARHEALPLNFASSVVSCLEQIRGIQSSGGQQPVLIGAITDGNSDPRTVPILREFFDFVVNAESIGVGKPDRRVYMKAIKEVASHPSLQDIFKDVDAENEDLLEDIIGPWWVHVGDDFLKDIVAAKDLGMRSIWAKELVQDQTESEAPKAPTKSVEEFVQEISAKLADNSVVEMAVGSDDYLAGSLRDEFADATVFSFEHVGETIVAWHEQAASTLKAVSTAKAVEDGTVAVDLANSSNKLVENPPTSVGDSKFCMSCGAKLPVDAKFCASCGEKQP
jgi:FMN phosphatase YigB (HAD superfamily)